MLCECVGSLMVLSVPCGALLGAWLGVLGACGAGVSPRASPRSRLQAVSALSCACVDKLLSAGVKCGVKRYIL